MKSKIVVFYGYVGFIGVIIATAAMIYEIADIYDHFDEGLMLSLLALFGLVCLLFYLIKTRFWSQKINELMQIEEDNEVLKKKIEKAELEEKLNKYRISN